MVIELFVVFDVRAIVYWLCCEYDESSTLLSVKSISFSVPIEMNTKLAWYNLLIIHHQLYSIRFDLNLAT